MECQAPDQRHDRNALHFFASLRVERLELVPPQGSRRPALLSQLSGPQARPPKYFSVRLRISTVYQIAASTWSSWTRLSGRIFSTPTPRFSGKRGSVIDRPGVRDRRQQTPPPAAGGKSVEDYGDLMRQSFEHAARVLKPAGRAILAFSNSDDQVWAAIQRALGDAGFETESVHLLNKGQPSIKGVKGLTGQRERHHARPGAVSGASHTCRADHRSIPAAATIVDQVIRDALTGAAARTDEIYSAVIRAAVEAGLFGFRYHHADDRRTLRGIGRA